MARPVPIPKPTTLEGLAEMLAVSSRGTTCTELKNNILDELVDADKKAREDVYNIAARSLPPEAFESFLEAYTKAGGPRPALATRETGELRKRAEAHLLKISEERPECGNGTCAYGCKYVCKKAPDDLVAFVEAVHPEESSP